MSCDDYTCAHKNSGVRSRNNTGSYNRRIEEYLTRKPSPTGVALPGNAAGQSDGGEQMAAPDKPLPDPGKRRNTEHRGFVG